MTRKPLHKFLPLTYEPKIPGVLDGSITQSIRIDTRLDIGDFIAFHGWEGRPYHSSWSFRTPYYKITLAKPINIHKDFVYLPLSKRELYIGDPLLDRLAEKDGIEPATGKELIRVLHDMHGPEILHGKILRWEPIPVQDISSITPSEMTINDLFEDHELPEPGAFPVREIQFTSEPKIASSHSITQTGINQRIFDKVRQAERDLTLGVQ